MGKRCSAGFFGSGSIQHAVLPGQEKVTVTGRQRDLPVRLVFCLPQEVDVAPVKAI